MTQPLLIPCIVKRERLEGTVAERTKSCGPPVLTSNVGAPEVAWTTGSAKPWH